VPDVLKGGGQSMTCDGDANYSTSRFSTDDLPERDRVSRWREVCGRAMMRVDMEPDRDYPFHCAAELRQLPNLALATITTTPNTLTRSRDLIADGNDSFIVVAAGAGRAQIAHKGEVHIIDSDCGWLIPSDEPTETIVRSPSRFVSLSIPASNLLPKVSGLNRAMTPIANRDALRLLVGYLGYLSQDIGLSTPEMRHLVAGHIYDLAVLAIGAREDARAHHRGLRVARLHAIKADILANLGSHNLSADNVAFGQGVTSRYVRKLFEMDGTSFSEFVLSKRLERAAGFLRDPRYCAQTISAIAFECGFSDLSYFNRTFRRRFGATPSDVREQARTDGGW
jgi:AraC-like DNA-binding protein